MQTLHGNSKKGYLAEINVTPLVDVMLVLLIIFMVTAPMMTRGIHVDLPATQAGALKQKQAPVIITINKTGEIYMENMVILPDALKIRLSSLYDSDPKKQVLIKADRDVPYGSVAMVMAIVKESGFSSIGLVTKPAAQLNEDNKTDNDQPSSP
jgi:biopolymer transport protein TolR